MFIKATAVFIGHNECYGVTKEQVKEAIISLIFCFHTIHLAVFI